MQRQETRTEKSWLAAPPPKRRKLAEGFENITNPPETSNQDKRKSDGQETGPTTKKRKTDLREIFRRQEEKKLATVVEEEQEETETETEDHIFYGETETVEMVNWEELFKQHQEETERIEQERRERQEKAEKQEQSWELLRVCVGFI